MRKIVYVNRLEASNLDEDDIDNMLRLFEDGFDQFETNLFALQQCANVYQAIEYLSKQDQWERKNIKKQWVEGPDRVTWVFSNGKSDGLTGRQLYEENDLVLSKWIQYITTLVGIINLHLSNTYEESTQINQKNVSLLFEIYSLSFLLKILYLYLSNDITSCFFYE